MDLLYENVAIEVANALTEQLGDRHADILAQDFQKGVVYRIPYQASTGTHLVLGLLGEQAEQALQAQARKSPADLVPPYDAAQSHLLRGIVNGFNQGLAEMQRLQFICHAHTTKWTSGIEQCLYIQDYSWDANTRLTVVLWALLKRGDPLHPAPDPDLTGAIRNSLEQMIALID